MEDFTWGDLSAGEKRALEIIYRAGNRGATSATSHYDEKDRPRVRAQNARSLEKKGLVLSWVPRGHDEKTCTFRHYAPAFTAAPILPLSIVWEVELAQLAERLGAKFVEIGHEIWVVRGDEQVPLT